MKRILLILFLISISKINLLAQELKEAVQQGHFDEILLGAVSLNNKTLTSIGKDNQIIVWDLNTGMQLKRLYAGAIQPLKIKYINEENVEIYCLNTNYTYDLISNEIKSQPKSKIPTRDSLISDKRTFSFNGPLLNIFENGQIKFQKTTQYFDLGYTNVLTHPNLPYVFASSLDGKIYVYDKENFKEVKLLDHHFASVNDISISSDGKSLFSMSKDRSIVETDALSLTLKRRFHGFSNRITSLSQTFDQKTILFGNELGFLFEFSLNKVNHQLINHEICDNQITSIIPKIKDSSLYLCSQGNKLINYQLDSKKINKSKPYNRLSIRNTQYNFFSTILKRYSEPIYEDYLLDFNDEQTACAYFAYEKNNRIRKKLKFQNKNNKKKKIIRTETSNILDIEVINDTLVAIKRGAKIIEKLEFLSGDGTSDGKIELFKIKGKKVFKSENDFKGDCIESYSGSVLYILDNAAIKIYDFKNNKSQNISIFTDSKAIDFQIKNNQLFVFDEANTIYVYTIKPDYSIEFKGKLEGHQGRVTDIIINTEYNLFISSSDDATIRFWSSDELKYINTLIPIGKSDFILIDTEGNYQMTKKGLRKFGYSSGLNFIYPDQLDLKYNKPHEVFASLGTIDSLTLQLFEKAYQKRLKKMGFNENDLLQISELPTIEILENRLLENSLIASIQVNDKNINLDRVNVYVNDVAVLGTKGFPLIDTMTKNWKGQIEIPLISGKNKIDISVLNASGLESLRKTLIVDNENILPSDLYVLTFGVSEFKDERYNLSYPEKDAIDISQLFSSNKNNEFKTVHTKNLINKSFNIDSLSVAKEFLINAKPQDVVIISVAGHGLLDDDMNYFLATYDINFSHPSERGLPYEELESLLDGIAPLKKVLFIDACHSGEIDKEEVEQIAMNTTSFGSVKFRASGNGLQKKNIGLKTTSELMSEFFTDLRKGTGATVISSAGGVEFAIESDEWKNGLFTYCLLHGLKDKAADANKDGKIMLSELQTFLRKEVTELSSGAQQPTSRIENLSMDFRIW